MIVVGTDVHKHTHTFVAVNDVGKKVGQLTVAARSSGHQKAIRWATEFDAEVLWAIEDCRALSARLERDLLGQGHGVVRVPPHMSARARHLGRSRGKSDPIDALAVAQAALREDLPIASHDEVSREARLLTDRRETLVAQRTRTINSLRARLHEIDPDTEPPTGTLGRIKVQNALEHNLADRVGVLAELARDELAEIVTLCGKIKTLDKRLTALAAAQAPSLVDITGCGGLTAAKLLGEVAGIARFTSEAQLARHAGIAPIPAWSGHTAGRVRLSRYGNRQLNTAIHRIALTQRRIKGSPGHDYYERKIAEGKTPKGAMRCLKRQIIRAVFRALETDTTTHANGLYQPQPLAA